MAMGILAACLTLSMLHGQEEPKTESSTQPQLSETTLKILEAQSQSTFEAPNTQVPDETRLNKAKRLKVETGGLLKEWFAPFEKKSESEDSGQGSTPKPKRQALWKWFDPTAPMSSAELQAKPVQWNGKRNIPQRFGNQERQEPQGWTLFFLRY